MFLSMAKYRSADFLKKNKSLIKKVAEKVYRKKATIGDLLKESYIEMAEAVNTLGSEQEVGTEKYIELPIYHEILSIGDLIALRVYSDYDKLLKAVIDNDSSISTIEYEALTSQDKCATINAVHHILETCVKRIGQEVKK